MFKFTAFFTFLLLCLGSAVLLKSKPKPLPPLPILNTTNSTDDTSAVPTDDVVSSLLNHNLTSVDSMFNSTSSSSRYVHYSVPSIVLFAAMALMLVVIVPGGAIIVLRKYSNIGRELVDTSEAPGDGKICEIAATVGSVHGVMDSDQESNKASLLEINSTNPDGYNSSTLATALQFFKLSNNYSLFEMNSPMNPKKNAIQN
jgi:hypothetical protein